MTRDLSRTRVYCGCCNGTSLLSCFNHHDGALCDEFGLLKQHSSHRRAKTGSETCFETETLLCLNKSCWKCCSVHRSSLREIGRRCKKYLRKWSCCVNMEWVMCWCWNRRDDEVYWFFARASRARISIYCNFVVAVLFIISLVSCSFKSRRNANFAFLMAERIFNGWELIMWQ